MSMHESLRIIGNTISKLTVGGPTNVTEEGVEKSEKEVAHAKRILEALDDMVTAVMYHIEHAPAKGADAVQDTNKAGK